MSLATNTTIHRGEVFLVCLDPVVGSEQGKTRPCVIIQNDFGNKNSPVTIVAAITSNLARKTFPINVFVTAKETKLDCDSVIMLNQLRTIDKTRLIKKVGRIPKAKMLEVDIALKTSLDLPT